MDVYTPYEFSISSFSRKVNPYCYKKMLSRWGLYKAKGKRGAGGRAFYGEVLSFYFELRFCCVRSLAILKLTDEVYGWLVIRLG